MIARTPRPRSDAVLLREELDRRIAQLAEPEELTEEQQAEAEAYYEQWLRQWEKE